MNCEQKSGVFLNQSCQHSIKNTCSTCKKQICDVHFHKFESSDLCEDCYWEKCLYAEDKEEVIYDNDSDSSVITSTSYGTSETTDTKDAGFDDGFGGGGFGGGGASGVWTDGEAQGFNETDAGGGLLDNDDTFYYS